MRRLPIFVLLDCSESMVGDKLSKVEDGIQKLVTRLRSNPYALETAYLSAIAFAGVAQTIAPLVELPAFYPPKLPLGGGTNLGAALETLMAELDRSVVKTTAEAKGDWKPIVYLFTDGRPTEDPSLAISRWSQSYAAKVKMVAIGIGQSVDFSVLRKITDQVLAVDDLDSNFAGLFDWVTASVEADCKSASAGVDPNRTSPPASGPVRLAKDARPEADDSCVTLVGRCQKSKKPYIVRYDRLDQKVATSDFAVEVATYHLSGCFPLTEDYFSWTGRSTQQPTIDANQLIGVPGCPYCGNISAFAVCSCGRLLCLNGPGAAHCPWCESDIDFSPTSAHTEEFQVSRGRG